MNIFGFNTLDAIIGLILFWAVGLMVGYILGFIKWIMFVMLVRHNPKGLTVKGGEIIHV